MKQLCSHSETRDAQVARKLAALAHPVRLRLLRHIGSARSCCVKEMVSRVGMAQSTVSQHLKVLVDAGLVDYRAERPRSCYRINTDALGELAGEIGQTIHGCCGRGPEGHASENPSSPTTDTHTPDGVNKDI
ncbi:MAG: metalloregulator ArsR/SmtB family transcription factor [Hoeflea sp.]|uniref:ArsR/SmtB family transcription factor n=1 Tax=Hoeflea sp. TaxID=1940281 RepID=UPI0032F00F1A